MTTTNASLSDMLAQLPEDLQAGAPPEPNLADIVTAAGARPVPIGRFSRFWTLGTLQGKIAAAYTFWWVRGMWTGLEASGLIEPRLTALLNRRVAFLNGCEF